MATSITATATTLPHPRKQSPALELVGRWLWRVAILILISLVLVLAWFVAYGDLYKPGSTFGYNLGLVGGLMMLTLLLYPLRKRIPALDRLGSMMGWFKYHMVLGIGSPVLILFHSTFRPVSMNGKVAFYSMIMVLLSGIVGRYVYRHVHVGLYGRELTLADAERELTDSADGLSSVFAMQPTILQRLQEFREAALKPGGGALRRTWRFLTLHWQGRLMMYSTRSLVNKALAETAEKQRWTNAQRGLGHQLAIKQITAYVDAVCKTASYSAWQYIFSLWHLVHIPFLYLLIISAIAHVIAVHMY
jgi:hypothetical protein